MPAILIPLFAALALACSDSPTSTPGSPAERCAQASELACINSAECTLVQPAPGTYFCREAVGPCEIGFVQNQGTQQTCEAKPGCAYVFPDCYCAPDVTCVCGGGPPPQCVLG